MNRNKTTIKVTSVDVPKIVEHFHQVPYLNLDPDICYEKYKDLVIDPLHLTEQTLHISTAGFGGPIMLDRMIDRMIEQLAMKAGQKMFLNYIYGIDPADVKHQSWEVIISPLWSETLYRVRPIDIQKGGWKCRRRTHVGSIPARGAETKKSIL